MGIAECLFEANVYIYFLSERSMKMSQALFLYTMLRLCVCVYVRCATQNVVHNSEQRVGYFPCFSSFSFRNSYAMYKCKYGVNNVYAQLATNEK